MDIIIGFMSSFEGVEGDLFTLTLTHHTQLLVLGENGLRTHPTTEFKIAFGGSD